MIYIILTAYPIEGESLAEFIADNEEHRFRIFQLLKSFNENETLIFLQRKFPEG